MTYAAYDAVLATVAPHAATRANRLMAAIQMLKTYPPNEVRRILRERFGVSRWTAWRIVDMAIDMT